MRQFKRSTVGILGTIAAAICLLMTTGCPLLTNTQHGVLLMFTLTDLAGAAVDRMEVTVDQVSLVDASNVETVIYNQPLELDFKASISVPPALGFSLINPGNYSSIKLRVSALELVFANDLGTVHTEAIFTNGNPITISGLIPFEGTGQSIIQVNLNSLDVNQTGPELTFAPQALISNLPVTAQAVGKVGTVVSSQTEFFLALPGGNLHVNYSAAGIFLPGDGANPTGDASDLTRGRPVRVTGSFQPWGDVAATKIELF
ncbi:MAG: hypothetical protein AMXMBFR84_27080 [Candidatus Hydrogenedentota bacterium]